VAGRCVLQLGDSAGARIIGEDDAGDARSLAQAIAQAPAAGKRASKRTAARGIASLEHAVDRASQATDKVEEVADKVTEGARLVAELASGRIDVDQLAGPAAELFALLRKLDREGRWDEALRVARCVAILLALLQRWAELLDSLGTALSVAEQLKDTGGKAWALHEQGTLRLAAEDYAPADDLLSKARELREAIGDRRAAKITAGNQQELCKALRARLHEPARRKLVRVLNRPVPTFVLGVLLLIAGGAAGALIRGSNHPTRQVSLRTSAVAIAVTPSSPRAGEPAAFTATVIGARAEGAHYEWRFGDADGASVAAPTHVYQRPRTYTVTLTVTNAHGAITGQGTRTVDVRPQASPSTEPPPPSAGFRFSPSSPVVGQAVDFDASSSSDLDRRASITGYVWKFGDGSTQTGPTPTHRYDRPGTYTAELVVADTREASASTTRKVVVRSTTPSAPTDVAASAGEGSATVMWAAPASGGSAIASYTITPYVGAEAKTAMSVSSATHATVGGLSNGTTYTFTVSATNSVGQGAPSAHSNPVTPTSSPPRPTAPSTPTGVSASPGEGSATVTWTAPASGSSAITSYTVTPYVGEEAKPATTVSGTTSTKVSGLSNGATYTFTVSATNSVGTGPRSEHSSAVTPAGVPAAATNVKATAGHGEATVSWAVPASEGSAISSYTITGYIGEEPKLATKVTNPSGSGSEQAAMVKGLTNGKTYTFTVAATNGVGVGHASARSNEVTPRAIEPPPYEGDEGQGDGP
jgi:PKD repeat protein